MNMLIKAYPRIIKQLVAEIIVDAGALYKSSEAASGSLVGNLTLAYQRSILDRTA